MFKNEGKIHCLSTESNIMSNWPQFKVDYSLCFCDASFQNIFICIAGTKVKTQPEMYIFIFEILDSVNQQSGHFN